MREAATILFRAGLGLLVIPATLGGPERAQAATLTFKPFDTGVGVLSQQFPDNPSASGYVLDDVVLNQRTQLQSLVVFGFETGNPLASQPVFGGIFATPDVRTPSLVGVLSGSYVPVPDSESNLKNNLVFNLTGTTPLNAGTYYVSAWVQRNSNLGNNQPFRAGLSTVNGGSIAYFQNPGGGFNLGSEAVPVTTLNPAFNYGLAFRLDGTAVAVPLESDLAGVTALAGLGLLIHRRRQQRQQPDLS